MQATPLLALLQQYMKTRKQRHDQLASSTVPSTVYFVWSARALCELQLLGREMLRACCGLDGADTWLHAVLHYTGFEQELQAQKQHKAAPAAPAAAPTPVVKPHKLSQPLPLDMAPVPTVYITMDSSTMGSLEKSETGQLSRPAGSSSDGSSSSCNAVKVDDRSSEAGSSNDEGAATKYRNAVADGSPAMKSWQYAACAVLSYWRVGCHAGNCLL